MTLVQGRRLSANTIKARSLRRARSWPRGPGLQRLGSVTPSQYLFFLFLIWQRVQSGTFCNDTQSRPRIIRKHDQSKISPKGTQLTQGAWPAKTTSQSVSLFAIDQGQRLSESTIKTTNNEKKNLCRNWYFWGHHQHFMVFGLQTIAFNGFSMVFGHSTISIKFYSAHTPLLSMSFPWFLGHSTIDFNSHVPSMMGRRNCFDGPFTSNFHWHCFWTFLNELL